MAGSIHVTVRRAVIAGLADLLESSDPDVSVTYGWQGNDSTAAREQIYTSNARASHDVAALKTGRNFRNEQMDFDLTFYVEAVGETPDVAETRAGELALVGEEFIADHKSNELGIAGLNWIRVVELASDYRILPGGGSAAITVLTLRYDARLT